MARVSLVGGAKQLGMALAWIVLFVVMGFAVTFGLSRVLVTPGSSHWNIVGDSASAVIGFVFATWFVGWFLNKQSWDRMGWRSAKELPSRLGRGIALGGVMAATAIAVVLLGNGAEYHLTAEWPRYAEAALPLAIGLLLAALFEELLFRGYPLRRLADAIGPWAATLLIAAGFGAAHLANPGVSAFGTVNIVLAGVWLSFAFFSPGGMAYAWGLHFGWNAGLALVFDAPVSGVHFQLPAVEYAPGARTWMDGGAFGPEGGMVGTIVILAGTLAVLGARAGRPKEWLP